MGYHGKTNVADFVKPPIGYEPYCYQVTGEEDTGETYEFFQDVMEGCERRMGTVPALNPGQYVLKVYFRRFVDSEYAEGYAGEDVETEISFEIVPELLEEKENLVVEIEDEEIKDVYVEAANLIAEELGKRLRIYGASDNDRLINEMLNHGEIDLAVGYNYSEIGTSATSNMWDVSCSKTYFPHYLIFVSPDSDITCLEDLAEKNIYVIPWSGEVTTPFGIWEDFWNQLEGESVEYYNGSRIYDRKDLQQGMIDAMVMTEKDYYQSGLRIVQETVLENGYKAAVALDNEELLEEINQAIDALAANGKLQELINRYYGWADLE